MVRNSVFHLPGDQADSFADFDYLARLAVTPQPDACPRFVDQIDRTIRQMTVSEKPARGRNGCFYCFIGNDHSVKFLVPLPHARNDVDRFLFVRRQQYP